jgi:hemerythrin superfamily protein
MAFSGGTAPELALWASKGATPRIKERPMAKDQFTDAIALLKADHREVEELFAKFENASGDGKKQQIAEQICTELKIHTMIEEEIFYPALEGKIEEDTLSEAYVEHDGAKVLINDIVAGGPDDEFYDAKVKVLGEEIEHHVKEEEAPSEGMFAQARKADVDLIALRDLMMARKEELLAQAESSGLPPAQPAAVNPQAA